MKYPFLTVFLPLILGVLTAEYFNFNIPIYVVAIFLLLSIVLTRIYGLIVFIVSIFLLGISVNDISYRNLENKKNINLECKVSSIPKIYPKYITFSCKTINSNYKELIGRDVKLKIFSKKPFKLDIFFNTKLKLNGNLKVNERGIYFYPKNNWFSIDNGDNPFIPIWYLKRDLIKNFKNYTEDKLLFSLGTALIFGERSYIDKFTKDKFVNSGLIHLLAISGLHVGLIITVFLLILYPLGKRVSYLITIIFLIFYPVFTGFAIPVVRASLMGILFLVGKFINLRINSLNILFFIGSVLVLLFPKSIFSISFQLSFIAVLGILLFIENIKLKINSVFSFFFSSFLISIVAMLFTTPIILYYFGKFSPISTIATPIAMIPVYPYVFLSVLNTLTGFNIEFLVDLMNRFGELFLSIAFFFGDLKIFYYGFNPNLILVIFYILILIVIFIWKENLIMRATFLVVSTTVFLFLSVSKTPRGKYEILKIKKYVIVVSPERECYLYVRRYNSFIMSELNKLGCEKRYFIKTKYRKKLPDGFDEYILINTEHNGVKFIKNGKEVLVKINGKLYIPK